MTTILKAFALAAVMSAMSTTTGCMLIEGAIRSGDDGRGGRYASKSYGQHVLDATFERPRRQRHRARIVVCQCHSPCHHRG